MNTCTLVVYVKVRLKQVSSFQLLSNTCNVLKFNPLSPRIELGSNYIYRYINISSIVSNHRSKYPVRFSYF